MMTYYPEVEARNSENYIGIADSTYTAWCVCAEQLGITVEEYISFMHDMEFDTFDYTLEEIEGMYADYCAMYEIPCMQIDISNPLRLIGAI